MAFEFRYQRILEVRELQEEQKQVELAEVQSRLEQERSKLEHQQERLDECYQTARSARGGSGIHAVDLLLQQQHSKELLDQIKQQRATVQKWEQNVEQKRQELIEASRKKRVLETLKTNDREEYLEEQQRKYQRRQNEIATRQYYRSHHDRIS